MDKLPIILIVGKPGAGKSTFGRMLASELSTDYYSIGGFIREVLKIPDPHISVDKNMVLDRFHEHLLLNNHQGFVLIDCHPYPQDYLRAIREFVSKPGLTLHSVIEVYASDEVALRRLDSRLRAGDPSHVRLKYYNDHRPFIDQLTQGNRSLVIDNTGERTEEELHTTAQQIITKLGLVWKKNT